MKTTIAIICFLLMISASFAAECTETDEEFDCGVVDYSSLDEEYSKFAKQKSDEASRNSGQFKDAAQQFGVNLDESELDDIKNGAAQQRSFGLGLGIDLPKCPVKVPMCYRTRCGGYTEERSPSHCLSNPACCFDGDLHKHRHAAGPKYMRGAPVCYYGATSVQYQNIANMFRPWNAFFTENILKYFSRIFDNNLFHHGGNQLCYVNPYYHQERTICGWPGISELDCNLKGCCFGEKKQCFYPDAGVVTTYRQRNVYPELHAESLEEQSCSKNSLTDPNLFQRLPCLKVDPKDKMSVYKCQAHCCMDMQALPKGKSPPPPMYPPYNPYQYPGNKYNPYQQPMSYYPYGPQQAKFPNDDKKAKSRSLGGFADPQSMLMDKLQEKIESSDSPMMQYLLTQMMSKYQKNTGSSHKYPYDKNHPPMGHPAPQGYPTGHYGNPPMGPGYGYQPMGPGYGNPPMGPGYGYPPMGHGYPPHGQSPNPYGNSPGYSPTPYNPYGSSYPSPPNGGFPGYPGMYPPMGAGYPGMFPPMPPKPAKCPFTYKKIKGLPSLSHAVKNCCKINICYHKKAYVPKPKPSFGEWSRWSGCERTCGNEGGTRTRTRMCMDPNTRSPIAPGYCQGPTEETQRCPPMYPCPTLPPKMQQTTKYNPYYSNNYGNSQGESKTDGPTGAYNTPSHSSNYNVPNHVQTHNHPGMNNPHTHYPQQNLRHTHPVTQRPTTAPVYVPPPGAPQAYQPFLSNSNAQSQQRSLILKSDEPKYTPAEEWMEWGECQHDEGECVGIETRERLCYDENRQSVSRTNCMEYKMMDVRECNACPKQGQTTRVITSDPNLPPPGPSMQYQAPIAGDNQPKYTADEWMEWGACHHNEGECAGVETRVRLCYNDNRETVSPTKCEEYRMLETRTCNVCPDAPTVAVEEEPKYTPAEEWMGWGECQHDEGECVGIETRERLCYDENRQSVSRTNCMEYKMMDVRECNACPKQGQTTRVITSDPNLPPPGPAMQYQVATADVNQPKYTADDWMEWGACHHNEGKCTGVETRVRLCYNENRETVSPTKCEGYRMLETRTCNVCPDPSAVVNNNAVDDETNPCIGKCGESGKRIEAVFCDGEDKHEDCFPGSDIVCVEHTCEVKCEPGMIERKPTDDMLQFDPCWMEF